MRYLASIVCVLLSCVTGTVRAQEAGRKNQCVVVPPELNLLTVAVQPGSPLQFENVRQIAYLEQGGGFPDFRLRNVSTKPIRSLRFAWWTTEATGAGSGWLDTETGKTVAPGQLVPFNRAGGCELVPLTEELRDKRQLRGPMRAVSILTVTKVTFADGSVYDATPLFRALRQYTAQRAGFDEEELDDDVEW